MPISKLSSIPGTPKYHNTDPTIGPLPYTKPRDYQGPYSTISKANQEKMRQEKLRSATLDLAHCGMIFLGQRCPDQQMRRYLLRYPKREARVIRRTVGSHGEEATVFVGEEVALEHFARRDDSGCGWDGGDVYFPDFYPRKVIGYGFDHGVYVR